ncbi:MAG TPA: glycosyltransferase [Candidatus Paceibacterota bacterium]|nr:glycosyltransferase [Candidatus Paceibacterota bacterium]
MRLLIVTQAVDAESLTLSFFLRWIEELAGRFDTVQVICLYEGRHALPENVTVHSLGKEKGIRSKVSYAVTFLQHAWRMRKDYDAVFIHMNEEYVLVGGMLWKLLGKRVYLWRNHYAGSLKTRFAGFLSDKVFYTSRHSYTASFPRSVRMPVGVDLALFQKSSSVRIPRSILFFGRFSPSKHPDILVEALGLLAMRNSAFSASFYGSAAPEDEPYRAQVIARAKELGLSAVRFFPGVPHHSAPEIFGTHALYVNLAESGMFDKMLFEAAAAGALVLARSDDWRELMGDTYALASSEPAVLADRIEALLGTDGAHEVLCERAQLHSLTRLGDTLAREMTLE